VAGNERSFRDFADVVERRIREVGDVSIIISNSSASSISLLPSAVSGVSSPNAVPENGLSCQAGIKFLTPNR